MGVDQYKELEMRTRDTVNHLKSSHLFLRASPCACPPASAWDSGRGGYWNSSAPWAPCSAEEVGIPALQKERKSLSPALKQHQPKPECSSSSWGLGGSSQGFSFPGSSPHTQLGHTALVSLGARLRARELICGQGRELRCSAAGMWVWTICWLQRVTFSSH